MIWKYVHLCVTLRTWFELTSSTAVEKEPTWPTAQRHELVRFAAALFWLSHFKLSSDFDRHCFAHDLVLPVYSTSGEVTSHRASRSPESEETYHIRSSNPHMNQARMGSQEPRGLAMIRIQAMQVNCGHGNILHRGEKKDERVSESGCEVVWC